ncbi:hypothetical protein F5I97DRAFT_1785768, partial [Phlebopus sp. FC_14]
SATPEVSVTSSHPSPAPGFSSSHNPFSIPHPKKFNAVNINKTFLQKTSTSSGTVSHSRLVTAKLTSTAQPSPTAGLGWSRPSSATPPVSTTPSNSSTAPPPASVPAAPPFPHAGKVIQPQPRNATMSSPPSSKKDGPSTKPAWGNAKSRPVTSSTEDVARGDFPTAAEVAHGRGPKSEEHKAEDLTHAAQVAPQEADAFRGVHLDPNAHHWDEMEEDDDNFLPNVIEFGDGRQYKIASTDAIQAQATDTSGVQQMARIVSAESAYHVSNEPVRREDRFADDYDRSWPRSKRSPTALLQDFSSRSSRRASTSSTSRHSPVEGPRVLFNERSNRLEPYSSSYPPNRHGAIAGQHGFPRRGMHAEPSSSVESRMNRDTPPHTPTHPVQLLQKSDESGHKLSPQPPRNDINDSMGRRHPPEKSSAPPSGGYASYFGQNRARAREGGILPTSTSGGGHSSGDRPRRSSGAPSDRLRHDTSHVTEALPGQSQPHDLPSQTLSKTENISNVQAGAVSGVTAEGSITELDIEGVHKATMHISAERARQRRQLEEEEREKERERARKKAAELEMRMRLAEANKEQAQEAAAIEIIREAVSSPQAVDPPVSELSELPSPSLCPVGRPPSPRANAQTNRNFKASQLVIPLGELGPAAEQSDSWRSKPGHSQHWPLPPSQQPIPSTPAVVHASGVGVEENLEVVDFSDLAKFVGVEEDPSVISSRGNRPSRPARPVASDFFEEPPSSNGSTDVSEHKIINTLSPGYPADHTALSEDRRQRSSERSASHVQFSSSQESRAVTYHRVSSAIDGPSPAAPGHGHPSATSLYRHNRVSAPFREAPMSALDDVMSRIKGALDNMQVDSAKDASLKDCVDWRCNITHPKSGSLGVMPRAFSREGRWLPPALRPRHPHHSEDYETFDATGCDPPRSPQPALTAVVVNMPRLSRPTEPVPKRQLRAYESAVSRVRFDILSWDPPVEGMSRRDLSVNDILFGRIPQTKNIKVRYRVALPNTIAQTVTSRLNTNFSSAPSKSSGPSSRSKGLDDLATWRRGSSSASAATQAIKPDELAPALGIISCSPPPEPPGASSKSTKGDALARTEGSQVRPRTQPKMPIGSAVGFYRNPNPSTRETNARVNFTVNSELEESPLLPPSPHSILPSSTTTSEALPEVKDDATESSIVDVHCKDSGSNKLALVTQVESRSSEESAERSLVTPASTSFSTPWTKSPLSFPTKDSPARGPDPEHLKAVWSQAADKELLPAVNSLEGIADDLTALPFTIQDVKSEDGETPPPTSSVAPSRISLHDVTRAFQRVPSSSNTASLPPLSPGAGSGPISRPSNFNYVPPLQTPGVPIRQHYAAFPSPMLAHSPSPTLLYPPAAPSPPRVLTSSHSQSMNHQGWMPVQTSQNHSGAARHLASPYPAQIMAYPPPNGVAVYSVPSSHQNLSTSTNGATQPRPRAVPLMSPIMHPPASANLPLYSGSPILMAAPPMVASGPRPFFPPAPPARIQARPD